MRRFFCLILFVLSALSIAQAQNQSTIDAIDRKVVAMNAYNDYTKRSRTNQDYGMTDELDNGVEAISYTKNGVVERMDVIVHLPHGKQSTFYYYSVGKLIYVREFQENYPWKDAEKQVMDTTQLKFGCEQRYYFNNGKLLTHFKIGDCRIGDEERSNEQLEKDLLEDSRVYLTILRK